MIKTWADFFNAVVLMREKQRSYFLTRSPSALIEAKAFEQAVDQCIKERASRSMETSQSDLFGKTP